MKILKHIFVFLLIVFQAVAQDDPKELFKFAKFKFDNSEFKDAINYLDKTIALDPNYSNAYLLRGEINFQTKNYQSAISDFEKAFSIDTAYSSFTNRYHILHGKSYIMINEIEQAEKVFNKLIARDDYNSAAYYELAELKFLIDDPAGAITAVNKAIKIDPKVGAYYAARAYYYQKTYTIFPGDKKYQAVNDDYNLAVYLDPGNYEFYKMRSEFKRSMGQEIEALTDYNKMIELSPKQDYAYTERGMLKMNKEKYVEAIDDFSYSIELHPEDAKNFRYRGLCKHNLREYYSAYHDFTKSIDLLNEALKEANNEESIKSVIANTYLMRGHSLFAMGKSSEACVDFLKALDLGERKGLNYFRKYCRF